MVLREGWLRAIEGLKEADGDLAHSSVRSALRNAVYDAHRPAGEWASYLDHTGDGSTGDVMYEVNGATMACPYSIAETDGKQAIKVDTSTARKVIPQIVYRDMAEGATGKTKESAAPAVGANALKLAESGSTEMLSDVSLSEAAGRTDYPVKIISPGTGSTAHYPADVLERDGPKVFKRGTLMFWNHQTTQESKDRPEGDLDKLAAILTEDARWDASGPKGPGLYSKAKVMADYAQKVEERAPHIGLSIRAGGTSDGTKVNGKPVLKTLDYAESVDYVTKAGRGGLALAEAARDAGILPDDEVKDEMKLEEAQALVNEAVRKATLPLILQNIKLEARAEGFRVLESVTLPQPAKVRIVERAVSRLEGSTAIANDAFVAEKFREMVVAEAKEEGQYLRQITGSGEVRGLGASGQPEELTEAQREETRRRDERLDRENQQLVESSVDVFSRLTGGNRVAAEAAATRRCA